MKVTLKASILAITLLSAGATAIARDHYPDSDRSYRVRSVAPPRLEEPQFVFDRYGNRVIATHSPRYAPPIQDRFYRAPIIVHEHHRAPVCEDRSRTSIRFEPPSFSPLRFLFRR